VYYLVSVIIELQESVGVIIMSKDFCVQKGVFLTIVVLLFVTKIFVHANPLSIELATIPALAKSDSLTFQKLRRGKAIIPFKLINNLIVVSLKLNESQPLNFILDSGVRRTLISELPENGEIILNKVEKIALRGLGGNQLVYGFRSPGNKIQIGKVEGIGAEVIVLEKNLLQLSQIMGTFVHGILGFDLFRSFIVEINYATKELILYERSNDKKISHLSNHKRWSVFPIDIDETKSFINIDYKHAESSTTQPVRLIIDTGSSGALSLFKQTSDKIIIPKEHLSGLLGVGLGGEIFGKTGRIHELSMNEFALNSTVVAYPDSSYLNEILSANGRNGSLGGDILRRFKVVLSYEHKVLLLRKNRNYREPFTYNRSGIDISTPFPNLPVYVVSKIKEGTEAERIGLKEGDMLMKIENKNTTGLELTQILEYLREGRNNRIKMIIEREGLTKKISFNLGKDLVVDE
jgi:hypothetical protein